MNRDLIIGNLINNPVYFGKPILKQKNGICYSTHLSNFLEIYYQLLGTLKESREEKDLDKVLHGCELLKQNRHLFWDGADNHDLDYGNLTNRKINCVFSVRSKDILLLVDKVIIPSLEFQQ